MDYLNKENVLLKMKRLSQLYSYNQTGVLYV